jgi:hypothetical protein
MLLVAGVATTESFTVVHLHRGTSPTSSSSSSSALDMKFMKDLGFEKPSWLPDFGGGDKKEETTEAAATAAATSDEPAKTEEEAVAEEK